MEEVGSGEGEVMAMFWIQKKEGAITNKRHRATKALCIRESSDVFGTQSTEIERPSESFRTCFPASSSFSFTGSRCVGCRHHLRQPYYMACAPQPKL